MDSAIRMKRHLLVKHPPGSSLRCDIWAMSIVSNFHNRGIVNGISHFTSRFSDYRLNHIEILKPDIGHDVSINQCNR